MYRITIAVFVLLIYLFALSCISSKSNSSEIEEIYLSVTDSLLSKYDRIIINGYSNTSKAYCSTLFEVNKFIQLKVPETFDNNNISIEERLPSKVIEKLSSSFGNVVEVNIKNVSDISYFRKLKDSLNIEGTFIYYKPVFLSKSECFVAIGDYPSIHIEAKVKKINGKWHSEILSNSAIQ